ncbi:UNVERIFIED_CONTAM: hypothetical protein FKN15_027048 [Acipenser sinensis]
MAALKEEQSYGLSCGRVSNGSNVSVFHVKLTDSALRAFEGYQNSKSSLSNRPSIRFTGKQGHISIPRPECPNELRTFSFYLSNVGRDGPQGSFDCMQQYVTGDGSIQLDCLGGIQDKITVCATDDSYQKARQSMAQVEEETRSRGAIVIKPGGRYVALVEAGLSLQEMPLFDLQRPSCMISSRKMCQSQNSLGVPGETPASPPKEHSNSASPSQKRPAVDFIDPLANKKPRISHMTSKAQSALNGKLGSSNGKDCAPGAPVPLPSDPVSSSSHLHRLEIPRPYAPLSDVSNDSSHNGCEGQEAAERLSHPPAPSAGLPAQPSEAAFPSAAAGAPASAPGATPSSASLHRKSKKKSKKHKDKEKSKERGAEPKRGCEFITEAQGSSVPQSSTDLNGACSNSSVPTSTSEMPDYLLKYSLIASQDQRQSYKNDFNAEYNEYRGLHARIERITRQFTVLDTELRQLPQGTETYKNANYLGSLLQSSTVCLGTGPQGDVYVPFGRLLPMVHPNDIVFDGWDISSMDLAAAMERAQVLDWSLQEQLRPHMEKLKPRPSIYFPEFIAANQEERADNVIQGTQQEQLEQVRRDIRDFKQKSGVDKVVVLWTANTERFCDIIAGVHDTAHNLLKAIEIGAEVSPSTLFAVASILEGCAYINGSPQNTFVPGAVELAVQRRVFIGGDDFKSGQTKIKSVLVDFLVGAGLKIGAEVSPSTLFAVASILEGCAYINGSPQNTFVPGAVELAVQRRVFIGGDDFKSGQTKIKSVLVDFLVGAGLKVVIKYVPYVGDSKRAMDEYISEIMMGGTNTIAMHNTCEDSLLASPLILDLVILTELCQRISFCTESQPEFQGFHSVLSILSYLCKAPLVPEGTPVVNALFKQRACIENTMRACLGLPPQNHMLLEHKMHRSSQCSKPGVTDAVSKKLSALSNGHVQNGLVKLHGH